MATYEFDAATATQAQIQAQLDAAQAGDTVLLHAGTYNLSSTLNVGHGVSLAGDGQGLTIIDTSSFSSYGIFFTSNDASLSNFSLIGPATGASSAYGIKAQPDPVGYSADDRQTNITIQNVTVTGSGKSEIDLNSVEGAHLINVTANGNNTAGVGIAITDSTDVTLTNISTSGNQWGSVSISPTNRFYDGPTDQIKFTGTYSATETIKIYVEDASNGILGDGNNEVAIAPGVYASQNMGSLTLPGSFGIENHGYQIKAGSGDVSKTWYFATESDADQFLALVDAPTKAAITYTAPDGHFLVKAGMSIQTAINAAHTSDKIVVAAGTFNENLSINKAVTIEGAFAGTAGTDGSRVAAGTGETIINGSSTVSAGATLDGLRIENHSASGTQFIGVRISTSADVTVENSVFYSVGPNGTAEDRAISLDTSATGHVTIDGNLITGDSSGKYSTASWMRGIWSDGSTSRLDITDNTFDHVATGINLDGYKDATTNVSHNSFTHSGTGISIGNTVTTPAVTGIQHNTFNDVDADFNLRNLTTAQNFNLSSTDNVATDAAGPVPTMVVLGTAGGDTLTGTAGDDFLDARDSSPVGGLADSASNTLSGLAGNDTLVGSNGNDVLKGGAGNDNLVGNGGIDTAKFDSAVTLTGGATSWTAVSSGSEGTDTLSGVEIVEVAGARTLLVGGGGYGSIQAAINAAQTGDTIRIAAGTYNENLTINTAGITLVGAGTSTIIHGTFKANNGLAEGASVADFLKTAASYNGTTAGNGVTIGASNVTLQDLKITGFNYDVELGAGINNPTLKNVTLDGAVDGIHKSTAAGVNGLTLQGGTISDVYLGLDITKSPDQGSGILNGLTIDGTAFTHITQKGVYVETLEHGLIQNITMSDVGQYGGGPAFGANGANGNGIDINLKYELGVYQDIVIKNFTFTNVGLSNGVGGTSHVNAGAIAIKARDDAPSYDTNKANFIGTVIIQNGSINGTSTGIRAGEPGKNIAGPAVTVTGVTITGEVHSSTHGDVANVTQSPFEITLSNADETFIASPSSTGTLIINGAGGNDNITGGAGDDVLRGGDGNDTLNGLTGDDVLQGGIGNDTLNGGGGFDTADFSDLSGGVTVNMAAQSATGAQTGTDTFFSIENAKGTQGDDTFIGSTARNDFDGQGGVDTIDYSGLTINDHETDGIIVNLANGRASGNNINVDFLTSIENVIGSDGDDTITGAKDVANVIQGNGGDDVLKGGVGSGEDVARYVGAAIDGIATKVNTSTQLIDATALETNGHVVHDQGTDIIQQFEKIQFSGADGVFGTSDDQVFMVRGNGTIATLAAADDKNATEDVLASGNVLANDVNLDGGHSALHVLSVGGSAGNVGHAVAGQYGSVTINDDGSYTYTANNGAAEALGLNETATDTFSFTVTDADTPETLTFHITGTNDAAIVTSETQTLTEGDTVAAISTTGQLSVSDVDSSSTFQAQTGTPGSYGSFSIDSSGAWSYTASSAHDEFVGGQTYTDVFNVLSADGTPTTVTVHITGTNDAATFAGTNTAELTEANTAQSAGGTVTVSDVDSAQSFQALSNVAGNNNYGTFSIGTDGVWTYTMNGAHDEFQAGHDYTDSVVIKSADNTQHTLSVTIHGSNDAATFGGTSTAELTETNTAQSTGGTVTVSDVDSAQSFQALSNVAGNNNYGTFSIGTDGVWTYTMNGAHDEFLFGHDYTDSVVIKSADNTASTLTVTIHGANEAPVAQNDDLGSISENGELTAPPSLSTSGALHLSYDVVANDNDPDGTKAALQVIDVSNLVVSSGNTAVSLIDVSPFITFNGHNIVFDVAARTDANMKDSVADDLFDMLGQGESATVSGTYTIEDEHHATSTASFSFTIVGANEKVVGTAFDDAALNGTIYADTIFGLDGDDNINANSGNDILWGGTGNNSLVGGSGNDVLHGGSDDDVLNGGSNTDTAVYDDSSITGGVTVSLAFTGPQDTVNAGFDTLTSIENLTGSSYNDTLTGSSGANVINGGGGNDVIEGGAGNDTLDGGDGIDTVSYEHASAAVTVKLLTGKATGGAGNDNLSNFENVTGSAGDDSLSGDNNANVLVGGAGDDTLSGGLGKDTLTGGLGADKFLFANLGVQNADTITDFSGGDMIGLSAANFASLTMDGTHVSAASFANNIVYENATGRLYYDADGVGGGQSKIMFAIVEDAPNHHPATMSANSFYLF